MYQDDMVFVVSSEDEEEFRHVNAEDTHTGMLNASASKDDCFVVLLTLFGKRLKEEQQLKALCKMHNAAPNIFTSSTEFKTFVDEIVTALQQTNDTDSVLSLMNAVCQTLSTREIVQDLKNNKDDKESLRDVDSFPSITFREIRGKCSTNLSVSKIGNDMRDRLHSNGTKKRIFSSDKSTLSDSESAILSKYNEKNKEKNKGMERSHGVANNCPDDYLIRNQPLDSSQCKSSNIKKFADPDLNPRVVITYDKKGVKDIVKKLKQRSNNGEKNFTDLTHQKSSINSSPGLVVSSSAGKNTDKFVKASINSQQESSTIPIVILDDNDNLPHNVHLKTHLIEKRKVPKQKSKKLLIKVLERKLTSLEQQIVKHTKKEMEDEEMLSNNSAYMQEGRLKEKFLHTWRKYCKLVGDDPDVVIASQKKIKVTSSRFPEINRAVSKYINANGNFPNIFEIKQVCLQVNDKYKLKVKPKDLHHCAVDVFTEVGHKLQKNRAKEFRHNAGNLLTDAVKLENDPASFDVDLKQKLKCNRKLAKQKTEQVFNDFVRKQYEQEASCLSSRNSDTEEDFYDVLDQLSENDKKKKLKHNMTDRNTSLSNNNVTKKKRSDKTVISVTVSSSQEGNDPLLNSKVDYRVTIDSPLTKQKSFGDLSDLHSSDAVCSTMNTEISKDDIYHKTPVRVYKNDNTLREIKNRVKTASPPVTRKDKVGNTMESIKHFKSQPRLAAAAPPSIMQLYNPLSLPECKSNVTKIDKKRFKIKKIKRLRTAQAILGLQTSSNTEQSAIYESPLNVFTKKQDVDSVSNDSTAANTLKTFTKTITKETYRQTLIVISDDEE